METLSGPFSGGVEPNPDAERLAGEMLQQDAVMREILVETLDSGDDGMVHESGRTVCGDTSNIQGPLARFPSSVKLASCPRGASGGTWHTHVTKQQLISPTNSLPDMANVMFGGIDVSIVAGTDEAEAFVAPADPHEGISEFQDALGVEVESADGVVDAIIGGDVPSPPDARRRVKNRLSPLVWHEPTGFHDLRSRLDQSGIPAHSTVSFEVVDAQHHAMVLQELQSVTHSMHRKNPVRDTPAMRSYVRQNNQAVKDAIDRAGIPATAGQVAVSEFVRALLRGVL